MDLAAAAAGVAADGNWMEMHQSALTLFESAVAAVKGNQSVIYYDDGILLPIVEDPYGITFMSEEEPRAESGVGIPEVTATADLGAPAPPCGVLVERIKHIGKIIVAHFTPATDQVKEQQKRFATYSQKALPFAITLFTGYLVSAQASTGNTAFKIAMSSFCVAVLADLTSATWTPKWGSVLVYLSWFHLVLVSYLLLVSFNKYYSYAIIPVPIPIIVALLQHKLWPAVKQQSDTDIEAGKDVNTKANDDDELRPAVKQQSDTDVAAGKDVNTEADDGEELDRIFNLSAGIVNCGGLVTMMLGHYMAGSDQHTTVSAIGFLFFFTVVLGLYLMMITTVRTVALTPHSKHLTVVLMVLLVITLITILIHGVPSLGNDSNA